MTVYFSWPFRVSDFAEDMHRYIDAMERQIEGVVQRQRSIANTAASHDEQDAQNMLLGKMEETLPRNLRYGALVTIYATVEQMIRDACQITARVLGRRFIQPEGVGMLEGAATFFSQTLNVEIIQGRVTWE